MAPEECEPTWQMTAIADRIEALTEMRLFEIDLVGEEELFVVDVNSAVSINGVMDGTQIYEDLLHDLTTDR